MTIQIAKTPQQSHFFSLHGSFLVRHVKQACEQALWGVLAAGREKEGELAATSLENE